MWSLAKPEETYLSSMEETANVAENAGPQEVLLETDQLSWAKYFNNGAVIISHGTGRSIWRIDPVTRTLKIYRLEIAFNYHDDLVERSAVEVQQAGDQLHVQASELDGTSPSGRSEVRSEAHGHPAMPLPTPPSSISGHHPNYMIAGSRTKLEQQFPQLKKGMTTDSHEFANEDGHLEVEMGQFGQRMGRVNMPAPPISPFGISEQAVRFLEVRCLSLSLSPPVHELKSCCRFASSPRYSLACYL